MKALRIVFAFAMLTAMPIVGSAADKMDKSAAAHPMYKADLSGAKLPGAMTPARGEAVFLPTSSVSGASGAGAGGVSTETYRDNREYLDTMSDFGTSVPGDNTGDSGPGQGFDQGGIGQAYEGFVNSDVNNTGSALAGTSRGVWGMLDDRDNLEAVTGYNEMTGYGAGGPAKGAAAIVPDSVAYMVTTSNIKDVTGASLHMGKPGSNGPVIASLFAGPKKAGDFSGLLAQGSLSSTDLTGPLAGKSIDDLVKLINKGDVYVNVLTDSHPSGEIIGAVRKVS